MRALSPGTPAICAPISAPTLAALIPAAKQAAAVADIVEWRADYYEAEDYPAALSQIKSAIPNTPLIFTLRSPHEGGVKPMPEQTRLAAITAAAQTGLADYIDAELRVGEALRQLKAASQSRLIVSCHDFAQTPKDCLSIFRAEAAMGADAVKLAVTPQTPDDVLTLLSAANAFRKESPVPIIAVSMGKLGEASRVYGHVFGSALTFAASGEPTAPGQISAERLRQFYSSL